MLHVILTAVHLRLEMVHLPDHQIHYAVSRHLILAEEILIFQIISKFPHNTFRLFQHLPELPQKFHPFPRVITQRARPLICSLFHIPSIISKTCRLVRENARFLHSLI